FRNLSSTHGISIDCNVLRISSFNLPAPRSAGNLEISDWQPPALMQTKGHFSKKLLPSIWPACWLNVSVALLLVCQVRGADESLVLPVWTGAVPRDYGTIGSERVRAPSEAPTKDARW